MLDARWLEQLGQDIRSGVRGLLNSPGFAVSAVLSLALGIGATPAIFSVIHGVIIDPFSYSHPETLYSFYATVPDRNFYFSPETPDGYLEGVARLLGSVITGISPFDPISFAAVTLLLLTIGILACLRPALRASVADPMTALRQE